MVSTRSMFLLVVLLVFGGSLPSCLGISSPPSDYLSEESVVLITGAAGFLGSELALALHRTYRPKKILLIDRMVMGGETSHNNNVGFSREQQSPSSRRNHHQQQEDLALFEFQRQRAFHVLQTLGPTGQFYRVDFRPMIPEYYDMGEVPVLDHIFRDYDITHVVHLADATSSASNMIIQREKEVPKAGMMEALLEQLVQRQRNGHRVPHFIYASSSEVYPRQQDDPEPSQRPPFQEDKPLSTPSSIRGASKLVDELLAKLYHDNHGIYSVGLRFFSVYGPWSVPGSPIFEMAERAVTGDKPILGDDQKQDPRHYELRDYVYIDDAIDAVMTAMQFRPPPVIAEDGKERPPPLLVINVASGQGTSLEQIQNIMLEYLPRTTGNSRQGESQADVSGVPLVGSTSRAKALLGYQPRVSLREGLEQTLAWHYDRAFPYGGQSPTTGQEEERQRATGADTNSIASKGIVSCLPHDKECLRAAPVFPCASECSHEAQCTHSIFDNVIGWTQALTSECDTVLYTVALDEHLSSIPSVGHSSTTEESFIQSGRSPCNLAFVSHTSDLVQSLERAKRKRYSSTLGILSMLVGGSYSADGQPFSSSEGLMKHGEWVLIPLPIPSMSMMTAGSDDSTLWRLLPKLSPGLFFAPTVQRAIYIDPNIVLTSIPKLLEEAKMQPYLEYIQGATAMLIGKGEQDGYFASSTRDDGNRQKRSHDSILYPPNPDDQGQVLQSSASQVQAAAYRMVRIAACNNKLFGSGGKSTKSNGGDGDGLASNGNAGGFLNELVDSRWLVHTLQSEDSRLFRCDVFGEVQQWEVDSDRAAFEFILGLHDMWSRVIAKQAGYEAPWWIGDNVLTVPEGYVGDTSIRRRLEEVEPEADGEDSDEESGDSEDEVDTDKEEEDQDEQVQGRVDDDDDTIVTREEGSEDNEEGAAVGFGIHGEEDVAMQEVKTVSQANKHGESSIEDGVDDDIVEDDEEDFDEANMDGDEEEVAQQEQLMEKGQQQLHEEDPEDRDLSSYDTWMGVLSATSVKYFVRIVPSSEVGVVSVND